ncbi:MAG: fibronectin type III domain-containing protein [Treponema sp.]|nr:fibronectin type III domain-containing protein [Treponema sp.]
MTSFRNSLFFFFSVLFFLAGCELYNLPLNFYINARLEEAGPAREYYAWFVSEKGNDVNDGLSADSPLLTVQKAIEAVKIRYRGGNWKDGDSGPLPALIFISGEIKSTALTGPGGSMAGIDGDSSVYPPLTLKGYGSGGRINAAGTGLRVLYIAGGARVTIGDNLALTGGSAAPGAGVLIQDAASSFIMRDGATVARDSDVYLPAGTTLTVGSDLTGTPPVAAITPETYGGGGTVRVLSGDPALIAANHGRFTVSPGSGPLPWYVDRNGFLGDTPLGAPVLNSLIPGVAQISASWSAVPEAATYEIYYTSAPSVPAPADPAHVTNITGTSCTLKGLDGDTTYSVWVRARTGLVISNWSNREQATTQAVSPADAEPADISFDEMGAYTPASFNPAVSFYSASGTADGTISRLSVTLKPGQTFGAEHQGTGISSGFGNTAGNTHVHASPLAFNQGENTLAVTVTAPDNITKKTYVIYYSRADMVHTVFYVSEDGDDRYLGSTQATALASVQRALKLINGWMTSLPPAWPGMPAAPATVRVGGTVTRAAAGSNAGSDGMIDTAGLVLPSLVMEGFSAANPGVLDAQGQGRVLNITAGKNISLGNNLTLTGGKSGGASGSGAGAYVGPGALFTMNGGTISGNAADGSGGGVYLDGSAAAAFFTMNGGPISGNAAGAHGGGVCFQGHNTSVFTMNGGARIAPDNDVYLDNGLTITMGGVLAAPMPAAVIRPHAYNTGTQVIRDGAGTAAANHFKFDVVPNPADPSVSWVVDSAGKLSGINMPVYRPDAGGFSTLAQALALTSTHLAAGDTANPVIIKILQDITASGAPVVVGKTGEVRHAQIISGGKTITRGSGLTGRFITVNPGCSLVLGDGSGALTIDGGMISAGEPLVYADNSSLEIKNHVSLQGGFSGGNGGAVYLYGASSRLAMSGGVIKNNTASSGGAVYVDHGTFEMTGGVIGGAGSGNKATSGGGVYIFNGVFNMKGNAKLSGNSTTLAGSGYQGGGVYLNGGTFSLGEQAGVEGNSAGEGPGAYYFNGSFLIKDNAFMDIGNPVYIFASQTIRIVGALDGSGTVAAIVPSVYAAGLKVLSDNSSGTLVSAYHNRFRVAGADGAWGIDSDGNLRH